MNELGALSQWEPYRSGTSMFVIDKGYGAPVCRVMFGGWTNEERESVANLIAAAPALLEALETILSTEPVHGLNPEAKMSDPMDIKIGWNVHAIARAAIARARGEA